MVIGARVAPAPQLLATIGQSRAHARGQAQPENRPQGARSTPRRHGASPSRSLPLIAAIERGEEAPPGPPDLARPTVPLRSDCREHRLRCPPRDRWDRGSVARRGSFLVRKYYVNMATPFAMSAFVGFANVWW